MNDIGKVLSDKAAISNWEDEGGALKPVIIPDIKTDKKAILFYLAGLGLLPFLYWLVKRRFQK